MAHNHEIGYKLYGEDVQFVEIELDPNKTVIAETGTMMYMEQDIELTARMGDGTDSKSNGFFNHIISTSKRILSGESLFLLHLTNQGGGKRKVAFTASYPGTIMAIDLDQVQGQLICLRGSFLSATYGTKVSVVHLGDSLFNRLIWQTLEGDGIAFIHAGGTFVERQLNNETIRISRNYLVAFESTINYSIQRAGNIGSILSGLFLITLSGTGRIWMQSLPFSSLADRILSRAPSHDEDED